MTTPRNEDLMHRRSLLVLALLGLAATLSCKNSVDLDFSGDSPRTASVEIRSSGFDTRFPVVRPGGQITFTNRDNVPHQIASDPHPGHGGCPELNGPLLGPGESFRVTLAEREYRCGFHDERQLDVPAFQGTLGVCRQFSLLGC